MVTIQNKSYRIRLSVVTPTFIGGGNEKDWMAGIDYIQNDGKIYVFDIDKLSNTFADVEKLANILVGADQAKMNNLHQMIKSKLNDVLRYKPFDCPSYETDNGTEKFINASTIKAFIRSSLHDVPVVPGSSLKGAIRSILLNYLLGEMGEEEKRRTMGSKKIEEDVFGKFKKGGDFMRFMRIGDAEITSPNKMGESTVILNSNIFNLYGNGVSWHGGWKHAATHTDKYFKAIGFNTLYECAAPGASGSLVISLKENAIDLLSLEDYVPYAEQKKNVLSDIKNLFGIINKHTQSYLDKELAFFNKYDEFDGPDGIGEIIENIEDLRSRIPSDNNSCLLKMAAGSGFHSITGDWQYADYDETGSNKKIIKGELVEKKKYKSRKIVEYDGCLSLMGFVELKIVD